MCINCRTILNRAVYQKASLSPFKAVVPCGQCEECKDLYRSEWTTRVAFELDSLYKNGGCAVFLTFTYNQEHLPIYRDSGFSVPAFNRKHVLGFLDKLNTFCWRNYGKGSMKYFFAAEYGKHTQRPHYHGLFFLSPAITHGLNSDIAVFEFVEQARKYWYDYGFMFPKYDENKHAYVDNLGCVYLKDGQRVTPRIRSIIGGSKYISKYVCKDMSYYGRSDVQSYLQDKQHKELMKDYLPKHWQSKGLGYSLFSKYDFTDSEVFKNALENGVFNPVTCEQVQLPNYVINKVLFKNVLSTKTCKPRFSSLTGKPLYDRELTECGIWYYEYVLRSRVDKTAHKMATAFQSLIASRYDKNLHDVLLKHSFHMLDYRSFVPLAIYKSVWCNVSDYVLSSYLRLHDGDISSLFDMSLVSDFVVSQKDVFSLRTSSDSPLKEIVSNISKYDIQVLLDKYNKFDDGSKIYVSFGKNKYSSKFINLFNQKLSNYVFTDYSFLLAAYSSYCRGLAIERINKNVQFRENQDKTRYMFKYQYNKNLC